MQAAPYTVRQALGQVAFMENLALGLLGPVMRLP
jgi:hypothetical protein